jgi:hypothetical protein
MWTWVGGPTPGPFTAATPLRDRDSTQTYIRRAVEEATGRAWASPLPRMAPARGGLTGSVRGLLRRLWPFTGRAWAGR